MHHPMSHNNVFWDKDTFFFGHPIFTVFSTLSNRYQVERDPLCKIHAIDTATGMGISSGNVEWKWPRFMFFIRSVHPCLIFSDHCIKDLWSVLPHVGLWSRRKAPNVQIQIRRQIDQNGLQKFLLSALYLVRISVDALLGQHPVPGFWICSNEEVGHLEFSILPHIEEWLRLEELDDSRSLDAGIAWTHKIIQPWYRDQEKRITTHG